MKKSWGFLVTLSVLIGYSSFVAASPASIEYVNSRIKEAVDTLLAQAAKDHKKMESEINNIPLVTLHNIGEFYQGGIIFWVDASKQHGLVVAKMDANQDSGMTWQNGESGDKITNAQGNGLYAGLANTQLIISQQTIDDQEGQFAALSAQIFSVQEDGLSSCTSETLCYGNWYLPSLYELQLVRTNLYDKGLGDFFGAYWSSTEKSVNHAFTLNWETGDAIAIDKSTTDLKVRSIHSF